MPLLKVHGTVDSDRQGASRITVSPPPQDPQPPPPSLRVSFRHCDICQELQNAHRIRDVRAFSAALEVAIREF